MGNKNSSIEDVASLRVRDTETGEGRDGEMQPKRMKQLSNEELLALIAERDARLPELAKRVARVMEENSKVMRQLAEKDARIAEIDIQLAESHLHSITT